MSSACCLRSERAASTRSASQIAPALQRLSPAHRAISTHIPATLRPWTHPIRSSLSLQIGHFGAIAQLAERLDRTQEVGGSNPPSSTLFPCNSGIVGDPLGSYLGKR